ncbi:fasciclin domain-containing protein [Methanocella sp. MCL-LM]|uniref:fasciclin domain-containing protein n=1 Tax=Methanocella sp. MCL-LM TaxID=3412035 RepID=UPI003C76F781
MDKLKTVTSMLIISALLLAIVTPALAQTQVVSGNTKASAMVPVERSDKDMLPAMLDTKDISIAAATMKAAGLEGMMMPGGKYTLFVASDTALNATSPDMKNAMKEKLNNKQVAQEFVNGHLVSRMVTPDELTDGKMLTTLNGIPLKVSRADGKTMVDDATLLKAVETNNGIVYVMDKIPSSIGGMMTQMGMMPQSTMPVNR